MSHDSRVASGRCKPASGWFVLVASLLLGAPAAIAQPGPEPAALAANDSAAAPVAADGATAPSAPGTDDSIETPAVLDSGEMSRPADSPNRRLVVGTKRVRLDGKSNNVVRSGPGSGFAIVGVYPRGMTFTVIARSGEWYDIRLSETQTGWVHASLCHELDDLSGLAFRPNPRLFVRTGSFVLSGYGGAYAFDRKSNSLVLGGRVGYYVFDRLQAEAGVSWTHVRRAQEIVESLFNLSLEAEDFQMMFYHLNVMWELLPGRQMVPFVSAGAGSTIMLGRSEPSFNFGAGTMLFLSKRTAMRWEVRDYQFRSGSDSARLSNDNIEFTLGTGYLF